MRRYSLAFFLMAILILLCACGGAKSASTSFNSAPAQTAEEGVPYIYTLSATNAAGETLQYMLTTAPEGATLQGDTITWTPTWAQSRQPNPFTVTATAGGVSTTQSWTVTPSGSIHGSFVDTFWSAQGSAPFSASMASRFAALVPQADGSLQTIQAIGAGAGAFTIPNVPAGYYWMQTGIGNYRYWTDSSSFDNGADWIGQPPVLNTSLALTFNVSGLDPWNGGDVLTFFSPNLAAYMGLTDTSYSSAGGSIAPTPPPTDGTTYTGTVPWEQTAIDPSQSASYVLQYEPDNSPQILANNEISGYVLGPSLQLTSADITAGSTMAITGNLGSGPVQSVDLNVLGSAWEQLYTQQTGAPEPNDGFSFLSMSLSRQPFVSDRVLGLQYMEEDAPLAPISDPVHDAQVPLFALAAALPVTTDDFGSVQFQDPFPANWLPVFTTYAQTCTILVTVGTESDYACGTDFSAQPSAPASSIAPLMSSVRAPLLNGVSLFTATAAPTTTPTLSWSPPTGIQPSGYAVFITGYSYSTLPSGGIASSSSSAGSLFTTETSLTVPSDLLTSGKTYWFTIEAIANGRSDFASAPNRAIFPFATSQAVSHLITVGSASSSAVSTTSQAASSQPASRRLHFVDSRGRLHEDSLVEGIHRQQGY
jgi:hypothetical protein